MREHVKRTKKHFSEEKSKTSRVIKKVYQPDKADKVKLYECRENTFDQFARNDTNKFNKIKKQTMHMIQLEKSRIKESVRALVQFQEGKNEEKRVSGEKYNKHEFIYVEIVLTQVPGAAQIRPIQVPLPAPIYGRDYKSRHCVLVETEDQVNQVEQALELAILQKQTLHKTFHRYLAIDTLDKKYKELTQKKKLCQYYDLFFCDYRVYGRLTKLIGGVFFEKKKFPFPVDTLEIPEAQKKKYSSHSEYMQDQLNFTYFQIGKGPVYTLKVGRVSQGIPEICKNIMHSIYKGIPHLLSDNRKHTNIKTISIKTSDSLSMPVFTP